MRRSKNSTKTKPSNRKRSQDFTTATDEPERRRLTPKDIVLIRHGESEGQVARRNGIKRSHPSLLDCGLTRRGEGQAVGLRRSLFGEEEPFDLVCVSPLTRALTTAVLGFTRNEDGESEWLSPTVVCFPGLAERGGSIPENRPRSLDRVKRDLRTTMGGGASSETIVEAIDFSMLPDDWPSVKPEATCSSLESFLPWLRTRPERRVAVVCHHNVILQLVKQSGGGLSYGPRNCVPIRCRLDDEAIAGDGITIVSSDDESFLDKDRESENSQSKTRIKST